MRELKDGIRSLVKLDFHGNVHKWFRGTDAKERFETEVKVLQVLAERGCNFVPKFISSNPEELSFVSSNCGAPVESLSQAKCDALFGELEREYGVRHDDAAPRNVTYNQKQGRFNLIDFELATILEAPNQTNESSNNKATVLRARWAADSRQGSTHKCNDDSWMALQVFPNKVVTCDAVGENLLDPAHTIFAVSDGMGGHAAGELASRLVLSWVRSHATELYDSAHDDEVMQERLLQLARNALEGLLAISAEDSNLKGMGATLSLAYLSPGKLHLVHAGDSRIYLTHPDTKPGPVTCLLYTSPSPRDRG